MGTTAEEMMKLALICVIALAAVEAQPRASEVYEVRTVTTEAADAAEGVMRNLSPGSEEAEDRFCWPPATPNCNSYVVQCNAACAALTPTYDPTKSCRITATRCIWSVYRDCNCSLFGSTTTTTTTTTSTTTTATTAAGGK